MNKIITNPYTTLLFQLAQLNFQVNKGHLLLTLINKDGVYALTNMEFSWGECDHFSVFGTRGQALLEQYPLARIEDMHLTLAKQLLGELPSIGDQEFLLCLSQREAFAFLQWFQQNQNEQGWFELESLDVAV